MSFFLYLTFEAGPSCAIKYDFKRILFQKRRFSRILYRLKRWVTQAFIVVACLPQMQEEDNSAHVVDLPLISAVMTKFLGKNWGRQGESQMFFCINS
jgi:hypothetical protein